MGNDELSKDIDGDLDEVLRAKDRRFILFYASWCPHSRVFLPIYDRYMDERPEIFLRVMVDEKEELMDRFSVQHVPTVLLFENGKIVRRCDGKPGFGISEERFIELLGSGTHE